MENNRENPDLMQAMLDAIGLFEELAIEYALIDGLAAMYYGRARYTEDVDFIAAGNHEAVLAAKPEMIRKWRFDPSCTGKLYHDSGIEIDLWKDAHVDEMVGRAASVPLAGQQIRIVEVHDLIAMKLRAQRPQDDYDVSEMVKRAVIDDDVLRHRVSAEEFEHYIQVKKRSAD